MYTICGVVGFDETRPQLFNTLVHLCLLPSWVYSPLLPEGNKGLLYINHPCMTYKK